MSLLFTDSADHYADITFKYSADSTAVVTAGAGRKGTSGIVTNGTTFFTLDRVAVNQDIAALALVRTVALKLAALPAATQTIMQFQEADGTNQVCIGLLSSGTVRAFKGNTAGATLASSMFPITPDIYYYVECKVFIDDVAGTVEVRLWPAPARSLGTCTILNTEDTVTSLTAMFTAANLGRKIVFSTFTSYIIAINSPTEAQVADTNSTGNTISGTGTISYIRAINFTGDTQNGGTGTLAKVKHGLGLSASWDDGLLFDTEGSAFNTFPGNVHIEAHLPDDAGFYTNWVPIPSAPNYGNVDDNPPDEDTSYNFAPDSNPALAPTWVGTSSSTGSATCDLPAGITEGDVLFIVIRTSGASESSSVIPDGTAIGAGSIASTPAGEGVGGQFLYDPFISPGSDSVGLWCSSVYAKFAQASEPASYTFTADGGGPLEQVNEIAMVALTGVNLSIPVEHASASEGGALRPPFGSPASDTITFAQVDADTDNDLIVAIEMTEFQVPATPSGYTNRYAGSYINISTKLKATAGGEIPPSTSLAAIDTWGTSAASVKARTQIITGGKDTFSTQDTMAAIVSGAMVNLCAKVDEAGHTVGAVMRQASTDSDSDGVTPTTDYLIYQFPYELAPDGGAWSAAKYNASEAGYALDAEEPPPPPEEAVIFEVDAANLPEADGDPIISITETGIHGYTLTLAHVVSGDYVAQIFDASAPAVNNEPSIVGITESLTCTPSTRNIGYLNTGTGTGSDLFLPDAFTIMAVFNITQFEGCWANGASIVIVGRKGSTIANFTGWQLQLDGGGDPGGQGELSFIRRNSVGGVLINLLSGFPTIDENTTYLGTVICDGTTVRLRLNGVEVSSIANATGTEPLANNQLNFLQRGAGFGSANAAGPPQGNVPFTKIWSIELAPADLASIEGALMTRYSI